MNDHKFFDVDRFQERIGAVIRNIRNVAGTHCIGADLSKLTDNVLASAIGPVLAAYDEELGAMFQQYSEASEKIGVCNGQQ